MKVYLAGPMRGVPHQNFPLFDQVKLEWEMAGHTILSPAVMSRALGYDEKSIAQLFSPESHNSTQVNAYLRNVMTQDILAISQVDAIALLPEWTQSLGCTVEVAYANFLQLPIYDAMTKKQIHPPIRPWYWMCVSSNVIGATSNKPTL